MKRWIMLLIFFFASSYALAAMAQEEPKGTVVGEGARSCKDFIKAKGKKENNFIIWVQGYFSAYNGIAPDIKNVLGDKDYHWVLETLRGYCKEDPDQYFNDAVARLVHHLHPKGIHVK